jgi:hypothetical protein
MYIDTFTCSSCEEDKPIDEFYKAETLRGHTTACKTCTVEASRVNKIKKKYLYGNVFRGDPFPKPRIIKPRKHYAP